MITMGWGASYPGGAEHQALLLADALAAVGRRTLVFAPIVSADRTHPVSASGPFLRRLPALGVPRTRAATFMVSLACRELAPTFEHTDILHTHMAWYHAMIPELIRPMRRARTVVKFACSGPDGEVATLSRTKHGRFALRRIASADRIVALTATVADEVRSIGYPSERIRVIPNGVRVRPVVGPPSDTPTVLFAGRLADQKGIIPFLHVWDSVVARVPAASLLVAGTGPGHGEVQRLAWGRPSVAVLGHRTDVQALLEASDVLVLPSRSEGMSNVVLEALAAARPVVAFGIPGVQELVDDGTGWVAPAGDFEGLADRLVTALSSPADAREKGKEGRRRIHERHAIDRIAALYDELYLELA